ncbi:hypothetical protein Acsp03_00400 [Actinomadura sp. NBRC 104412]|uniref:hypothetical protein n=1 Tax=Actinomadura sp. NBRC 104412 TaxID=3032203 RepID=UPI0024A55367|nr:hypothetical protein [Actinomadura sp. NBRC 104412]GLZ02573.1 hypothetical protein Acsp03_00400 [Actinomadura sp. NBRC 104412]
MPEEEGQPRRRGRPPTIRVETDEAAALVEFLQELTKDWSVRRIADVIGRYSKTTWAKFLNGSELIPPYLLEQLVAKVVPEPRLRQERLKRGLELLDKAERAAAGKPAPHEMSLPERELRRRLEQSQHGMIEAQQQLLKMTKLASGLAILVSKLQLRCDDLEKAQRRTRRDLSEQRQQFEQRLQIAEQHLAEAHQRQQEAEALRLETLQRVERYRLALAQEAATPPDAADDETGTVLEPTPEELAEYDTLLAYSTASLDETGRAVEELRRQLGIAPPEPDPARSERPRIVRGQVQDNSGAITPGATQATLPAHSDPDLSADNAGLDPGVPTTAEPTSMAAGGEQDAQTSAEGAQGAVPSGGARRAVPSRIGRVARTMAGYGAAVLGLVLAVAVLGVILAYFTDTSTDPRYQSGDRPRTRSHEEATNCTYMLCATTTKLDAYDWSLNGGAKISTVFGTMAHSPLYLRGAVERLPSTCSGARVKWTIHSGSRLILSGEVGDQRTQYRLDQRIPKNALVAVSAWRADRQPCAVVFRWKNPKVTMPAPFRR